MVINKRLKYQFERLEYDSEAQSYWDILSTHKYLIGAVWAYMTTGGTCQIVNREKLT